MLIWRVETVNGVKSLMRKGITFKKMSLSAGTKGERVIYVNENVNGNGDFETTHQRQTYWIHSDLIDELNSRCKRKGDKTRIVNDALRSFFREI